MLDPLAVVGYPGSPPLLSLQGRYSSSEEGVFKSPRRWHTQEEMSAHSQCQAMKDPLWELVSSANV